VGAAGVAAHEEVPLAIVVVPGGAAGLAVSGSIGTPSPAGSWPGGGDSPRNGGSSCSTQQLPV
jgi:hypothetical protein